jgi:hypothetical protein
VIATLPTVLGEALRLFAGNLPLLPADGSVTAPGWYRNGDATGFSLTYVAP